MSTQTLFLTADNPKLTLLALSYLSACSVALAGFSHTLHQKLGIVGKTLFNYNFE